MKTGAPRLFRRSISLAAAGILAVLLTACTGSGGGYLPPGPTASDTFPTTVFTGKASFGFNFSCEDKGGLNPPTGQLRLPSPTPTTAPANSSAHRSPSTE